MYVFRRYHVPSLFIFSILVMEVVFLFSNNLDAFSTCSCQVLITRCSEGISQSTAKFIEIVVVVIICPKMLWALNHYHVNNKMSLIQLRCFSNRFDLFDDILKSISIYNFKNWRTHIFLDKFYEFTFFLCVLSYCYYSSNLHCNCLGNRYTYRSLHSMYIISYH